MTSNYELAAGFGCVLIAAIYGVATVSGFRFLTDLIIIFMFGYLFAKMAAVAKKQGFDSFSVELKMELKFEDFFELRKFHEDIARSGQSSFEDVPNYYEKLSTYFEKFRHVFGKGLSEPLESSADGMYRTGNLIVDYSEIEFVDYVLFDVMLFNLNL